MSLYQAESFFRSKILSSITETQAVPFTIRLSKLPTRTSGLLTISPNTEYEEIVEFENPDVLTSTVDIIKRGISPVSIALTVAGTDYNNGAFMRSHTQNDIIRGDVNHLHINQGIGNSTLATEAGVGIVRLATAADDVGDPVVVGDNDPRLGDASTTNKGLAKLSVAPVSAVNPISVGDNDPRLNADTIATANGFSGSVSGANVHTIATSVTGLLKGNGTAMSSATEGTDYYKPAGVDVVVADGGTGRSTATAYGLLAGGTTSTAPHQSIAAGNVDDVLVYKGAATLPIYENRTVITHGTASSVSANATRYGSGDPAAEGFSSNIESVGYSVMTAIITNNPGPGIFDIQYSTNGSTGWTTIFSNSGGNLPSTFMAKVGFYRCRVYLSGSTGLVAMTLSGVV